MSFLFRYTSIVVTLFAAAFLAVAVYINQKPSSDTAPPAALSVADQESNPAPKPSTSDTELPKAELDRLPAPAKQIDKVLKDDYFVPDEQALQPRIEELELRLASIDARLIEQGYDPKDASKIDAARQAVSFDEGEAIAERLKRIETHLEQNKAN